MITLYGVHRSRASRPIWLMHEIGVPFNHVPVIQSYRLSDAKAADAPFNTASAAFLALAPMGQIPAMQDGDLILTESFAITLHLARTLGGDLGPKNNAETALMEQWALFGATAVEVSALEIIYAVGDGGLETAEGQSIIALAAERLRRPLARIEAHLSANSHIVGGRFTVADINLAECLRYAQAHPTLLSEFPVLKAWLETCQARPGFKKMWQARVAEPE